MKFSEISANEKRGHRCEIANSSLFGPDIGVESQKRVFTPMSGPILGHFGLLTLFPPSTHVSTHVSTDVSTDVSTHVSTYPHLFDFFVKFKNSYKIYEPNK